MSTNPDTQLAVLPQAALTRQVTPAAWNSLKELYDGASDESVGLVVDYCTARKLDVMKKPVHIVQVWSNRRKQMVDTIWPSIAEARITAMRTKEFAGMDETKFGPTQKQKLGDADVEFPEWAQVTVYRLIAGVRCAFPGPRTYFLESYATKRKDDYAPNAMWAKRTWGQLEKCAEAAALRRAFPEELGGQATAEEMNGRELDDGAMVNVTHTASAASTGTPTVTDSPTAGAEAPKRAAVPRKRAGGAAAATPAEIPPAAAVVTELVVEPAAPPAAIAPEPAKPADLPPPPAEPVAAPASGENPAGAAKAADWPQKVIGNVFDAKDARVTGNPKYSSVKVIRLGNGQILLNGTMTQLNEAGAFILDPERPELAKFGVISAERIEWTVDQQPSSSNPAKKNLIIIKAEVADVAM